MNTQSLKNLIYWTAIFILGFIVGIYSISTAHAESWDTAGNVVGANDYIGSTNGGVLKFKIGSNEVYRIQSDGMRFMKPITTITNSNGQLILNNVTANNCTGIYGNINKILNICDDGFTFTGGTVNFKTKYFTITEPTYTATANDHTIECNQGSMIYLPTGITGKRYEVINPHNTICTVFANGSELIGNLNPEPKYKILAGESVTIVSNGSVWRVLK